MRHRRNRHLARQPWAIRTVNDYVPNALKTDEHYPDLLALEKALSENALYNEIGALTHILATKPAPGQPA
jgi:hypothetical protein